MLSSNLAGRRVAGHPPPWQSHYRYEIKNSNIAVYSCKPAIISCNQTPFALGVDSGPLVCCPRLEGRGFLRSGMAQPPQNEPSGVGRGEYLADLYFFTSLKGLLKSLTAELEAAFGQEL